MIVNQLPDPRLFSSDAGGHTGNGVIHAITSGKYYYPNHTTPYVLVANFRSTGHYRLNGRDTHINEQFFYFLNAGDRLEIDFMGKEPLETMLVLCSGELVNRVAGYRGRTTGKLLDNGAAAVSETLHMPAIPLAYNEAVIRRLAVLKRDVYPEDPDAVLFELLDAIWALSESGRVALARIGSKRKSTREELYRRLLQAELFMRDNIAEPVTLDDIAKAACMNKFHFLVSFKQSHGLSPHQWLVRLKMEHARGLLLSGKYSVTEVCYQIGFESPGSFTHLFKRTFGFPPSKFPISNK
jgi:AraC family transcriptional regulator